MSTYGKGMTASPDQSLADAEQRVAERQSELLSRLAAFDRLRGKERTDAVAELLGAAQKVQDAEHAADAIEGAIRKKELEGLRDAAVRKLRLRGLVPLVAALTGITLALVGLFSSLWLLLLIPLGATGMAVFLVPIPPDPAAIDSRVACAWAAIGAAGLCGLAIVPWSIGAITVFLVVLAVLCITGTDIAIARVRSRFAFSASEENR